MFLASSITVYAVPSGTGVKNLPAVQETLVQSLVWEDSLEEEMAAHSRILGGEIPKTEEPGGLQSMGCTESDTTEWLSTITVCNPCSRLILQLVHLLSKEGLLLHGFLYFINC